MKTKRITLAFILITVLTACAQQYDPESDFDVRREENGITITKYIGSKQTVRIPPTIQGLIVTSIGKGAFSHYTSLARITIPKSVTSIVWGAFYGCTSLTSVTIPNSVTSIGWDAFKGCTNLTSVTIKGTIKSYDFGDINIFGINSPFDSDLRDKYIGGGVGTYTTTAPVREDSKWTRK